MNMAMRNKFAQQYANNYVETAVTEATPHKLVEMLYDGAIKNLTLMKVFMEKADFAKKAEFSNKSLAIINSLRAGVDLEKGGEIGENLFALYDYCYRRVLEASSQNDLAMADEVIGHLKGLRDAWVEMPENIKRASKGQIEKMSA